MLMDGGLTAAPGAQYGATVTAAVMTGFQECEK